MTTDSPNLPLTIGAADFSADRRRLDGTRSFWATSGTDGGVRLTRWDLVGGRWVVVTESGGPSWLSAVQNNADLVAVSAAEVTEYQPPDAASLLEVLVSAGVGDPTEEDWSFDVSDYEGEDDDFGASAVRRYARVRGARLYFAESDGDPLPFLVSDGEVDGEQLTSFSHSSEAGFSSWETFQVTPGTAVGVPSGDSLELGAAVRGFRFDQTPEDMARMIAASMAAADEPLIEGCTALTLDPLDPSGVLSDEQREAWQDELDHLSDEDSDEKLFAAYFVPTEVKNELRHTLSVEGSTYAKIHGALADPVKGDWLRKSLTEGDLQPLCY